MSDGLRAPVVSHGRGGTFTCIPYIFQAQNMGTNEDDDDDD